VRGGTSERGTLGVLRFLTRVDRALADPVAGWEETLQAVADAIPAAFAGVDAEADAGADPRSVSARIRLGKTSCRTPDFEPGTQVLSHTLELDGQVLGEVEVGRRVANDDPGAADPSSEIPVTEAQRLLLETVANRVSEAVRRRRAQEQCQAAEHVQQAVFDRSPAALFSIDPEGTVLSWNRAAERLFGWAAAEVVGTPLPLVPPDREEQFAEIRRRVMSGDSMRGVELVPRRRDGSLIDVSLSVAPIRSGNGDVTAILAVVEDVSEREEAWQRIRFQSDLLEAVGQAVVATDLEGRITFWNQAAGELFGWSSGETLGRDIRGLVRPLIPLHDGSELPRRLESEGHWTREAELEHRDGPTFHALVTNSPVRDEEGRLVGVIAVSSDIGQLKELEAHLRHSQKMEAVGRLAGGVAHDFNNLLTVIGSQAQMVMEDLPSGVQLRQEMRQILTEIRRASRLTRQLLAFGRREPVEERVLDLGDTITALQPMLRRLVPSRIDLDFGMDGEAVPLRADPSQVEQVVLNLAVNAADAIAGEGTIAFKVDRVRLSTAQAEAMDWPVEEGFHARLTVADTGHGMSSTVMEQIFEPFFSTKPEGEGTGLGLSTVFGIVKQARGGVLVESEPGRGSTFQVLFPLVPAEEITPGTHGKGEALADAPDEGPLARGAPHAGDRRRGTVLLVDDTPSVLDVARRVLERAGYSALVADNGQRALDLMSAHGHEIDIVVSDVVMPHMGGARLLDRLMAIRPGLPVILISGHSDRELPPDARDRASAFLPKPFGPRELVEIIRSTLGT
jgi:two-component system, cell cycle sensor histidine kinase and response regulator CckA